MKKLSVLLLLLFAGNLSQAQTFEEWFKQKQTQKKYHLQQLAALRVYLGYVQKGYDIAQKGLTAIGQIKQGDVGLHQDFFGSLKNVNPKISSYGKVVAAVALQLRIIQVYKEVYKQARTVNLFPAKEVDYILGVFENVLNDCGETIKTLTVVVASNNLEMKDDERLRRVDALYTDMQEAYTFTQGFGSEMKLLVLQRMKEKADVQISRSMNDLKNK